jgi:hypothetical protein
MCKAVLLDISKAYDTVRRDLLYEKISVLDMNYKIKEIMLIVLHIDDMLTYSINNADIKPQRGLIQGDPWAPILFNLYINNVLSNANNNSQNQSIAKAFADDCILISNNIDILKSQTISFVENLSNLGLNINEQKCELLTDNIEDVITLSDQFSLISKRETKYLGQIINSNGESIFRLKENIFTKMFVIMKKCRYSVTRIRLFNLYVKGKIAHTLPLICASKGADDAWKMIRKIIFKKVLEFDTMPKESMGLFKLNFYYVMVRPLVKMYNGEYFSRHQEEKSELLLVIKNTIKIWMNYEENLSQEMKQLMIELPILEGIINLKKMDEIHEDMCWARLNRGALGESNTKLQIVLPKTISFMSNAKFHQLESILKQTNKEKENKARQIIEKYHLAIDYLIEYKTQLKREYNDEWQTICYSEVVEDTIIKERINRMKSDDKTLMTIIKYQGEDLNVRNNNTRISDTSNDLLTEFRKEVSEANLQSLLDLEKLLNYENFENSNSSNQINNNNNKNIINSKNSNNNKKNKKVNINEINNNQTKITNFFNN